MPELRIDPEDGKAYTFVQMQRFSKDKYTQEEIDEYWEGMVPVSGKKAGSPSGVEVAYSIKLSVVFNQQTLGIFEQLDFDAPWQDILNDFEFKWANPPMTIEDLSSFIEAIIEGNYEEYTDGKDMLQSQIRTIFHRSEGLPDKELPWDDNVSEHLKSGDTVLVDAYALSDSMIKKMKEPKAQLTNEDLEKERAKLRFSLNDRVVCNCGPRWLAGHVVGTAVPNDGELLPYLVKTDKIPGLPSNTISVPEDNNDFVCIQEVCFDPRSQMHLIQACAALVGETNRPKLRFAIGDKVCCRVRNSQTDGLEQWQSGEVRAIWPKLSEEKSWEDSWDMGEVSGKFPDVAPYQVHMAGDGWPAWIYCHRDDHTLIRREGFQPRTRVRGVSKRMEVRSTDDGSKEQVDHVTERRKPYVQDDFSDSD